MPTAGPSFLLPQDLVARTLAAFDKRDRFGAKLPLWLVVQLTIAMALKPRTSIDDVLEQLVETVGTPKTWRGTFPHTSSITAARDRLGWEVSRGLFRAHARSVQSPADVRWRGLRVVALDGTTFRAPDTPANEAAFGKPSGSTQGTFPVLRCLAVADVFSHSIVAAAFAPYAGTGNGEVSLARNLVEDLDHDMLTLMDRGFCGFKLLRTFVEAERQFVVRRTTGKHSAGLIREEVLQAGCDYRVTYPVPNSLRPKKGATPLLLREVTFTVPKKRCKPAKKRARKKGKRKPAAPTQGGTKKLPRHLVLLTNLLDSKAYPAAEIAKLYLQRWQVEFVFREIKSTLTRCKVHFRSKKPQRVLQEVYATLTAYNQVRSQISLAASELRLAATKLSYTRSLRRLSRAHHHAESWARVLPSLSRYEIKERPARWYPREVKPGGSRYPRKKGNRAA